MCSFSFSGPRTCNHTAPSFGSETSTNISCGELPFEHDVIGDTPIEQFRATELEGVSVLDLLNLRHIFEKTRHQHFASQCKRRILETCYKVMSRIAAQDLSSACTPIVPARRPR